MQRKDIALIASAIRALPYANTNAAEFTASYAARYRIVSTLADLFERENPRAFRKNRFFAACGFAAEVSAYRPPELAFITEYWTDAECARKRREYVKSADCPASLKHVLA